MTMVRMGLSNYRCFVERQTVEIRPITVVLGKNNSGKSALVRAPLVISTGMETDSNLPFDLDKLDEQIVDSFPSLVYAGRPHGSLDIELDAMASDGSPVHLEVRVQNIDEYKTQVISYLRLAGVSGDIRITWEPEDPPGETPTYTIHWQGADYAGVRIRFEGLLPAVVHPTELLPVEAFRCLLEAAHKMRNSCDSIRYLGPFRERAQRLFRVPSRMPTKVGTSGEFTSGILANDVVRQSGEIIRQLNNNLVESLPDWEIDISERSGLYSVVLRSTSDETIEVNLADTGAGISQALPIFVQRAMDVLNPSSDPVLEIIEQPELHLHPAAHAPLADLYLAAAERSQVRFLIETHSETFLLRLRRRIAEQKIDPDRIALYYVSNELGRASAKRIGIDNLGNLDYWPDGVFSEDYLETKKIVKAQLEKADGSVRKA